MHGLISTLQLGGRNNSTAAVNGFAKRESSQNRSIQALFVFMQLQINASLICLLLFIPFTVYHVIEARIDLTEVCDAFLGIKLPCFTLYSRIPS